MFRKLDFRQKISVTMIFICCFCLLLAGARDILISRGLSGGVETRGEILSIKLHRVGRSRSSYRLSFAFEMDGKMQKGKDSVSVSVGQSLKRGQKVPIVHEPNLASTAALGTRELLWRHRDSPPMTWALGAGLIGVIGIPAFFLYGRE